MWTCGVVPRVHNTLPICAVKQFQEMAHMYVYSFIRFIGYVFGYPMKVKNKKTKYLCITYAFSKRPIFTVNIKCRYVEQFHNSFQLRVITVITVNFNINYTTCLLDSCWRILINSAIKQVWRLSNKLSKLYRHQVINVRICWDTL